MSYFMVRRGVLKIQNKQPLTASGATLKLSKYWFYSLLFTADPDLNQDPASLR